MSLFEKIIQFLNASGVWYELLEHAPVFTSEQAAVVRKDVSLHQGAKAMVVKVKNPKGEIKDPYVMVVCPGDLRIDFKKVRKFLSSVDATLASPEEVEKLVGAKIGAVSPFGNLSGLPTLVEQRLLDNEIIAFNVGDHKKSVKMKSGDYLRLSSARVRDFSKTF